jgi:hypothetical protein
VFVAGQPVLDPPPGVALRSLGPLVELGRTAWREPPAAMRPIEGAAPPDALVRLLGYRLEGDPGRPPVAGTPRGITLFWQADPGADRPEGLRAKVVLRMGSRETGSAIEFPATEPVAGAYPFARWGDGEVVADFHELPLDPGVDPGRYAVDVSLVGADGAVGSAWRDVTTLEVLPRTEAWSPPPQLPLEARLGEGFTLLGCDGCGPVRAGQMLGLRLYWRAGTEHRDRTVVAVADGAATAKDTLPPVAAGQLAVTDHRLTVPQDVRGAWSPRIHVMEPSAAPPEAGQVDPHATGGDYRLPPMTVRPPPEGLPAVQRFADGLALAGLRAPRTVVGGEPAWVSLGWESWWPPEHRYTTSVQLLDAAGNRVAGTDREVLHAASPTDEWHLGDRLEDTMRLDLPPDLPPGGYQLLVGLYDQGSKANLPLVDEDGAPTTGRLLFPVLALDPSPPPLPIALSAQLGDDLTLLGASVGLSGTARAGAPLPLTLRWRTRRAPAEDLTIFAHLVRDGELVAQTDTRPFGGAVPTNAWPTGVDVDTPLEVAVPADAPPGRYELHVGLYDLATGRRSPITGATAGTSADHVVLDVDLR